MHFEDRQLAMDRRDFLRLGGAGLAGAVLLGTAGRSLAQAGSLRMEFESAAQKYEVPVELLLAMGYVNTLWEMPPPSDYEQGDIESRGTYGVMQLEQNPFRDALERAASLTGLSEEQLKTDRASNIEGGAALLSDIAGQTKPDNLDGWREVVAAYADTDLYASEVYGILKSGVSLTISTGENITLSPQDVTVPQVYAAQGVFGYPRADWRPADRSNYTNSNREASINITKIVIHVAQGSYSDTISWFKNPRADSSAHYVVSRTSPGTQDGGRPTSTRSGSSTLATLATPTPLPGGCTMPRRGSRPGAARDTVSPSTDGTSSATTRCLAVQVQAAG
jgi:hypothetical protein